MCLMLAAGVLAQPATTLDRLPVDGYAATVNEEIITISDVRRSIQEMELRLRARYAGAELEQKRVELFMSGLEQLVDRALIIEEFKSQKIEVPERMVEDEISDLVKAQFDGDRAALLNELAEQQITIDDWREMISEGIMVRIMRSREVGERIVVSPRQVLEAYEARKDAYRLPAGVDLRMMFKRAGDEAATNRAALVAAREAVLAGQSFTNLAKTISEDPSATTGGSWGWVDPTQFRDEIRNAIIALPKGEVSDVIDTTEGFYLLYAEDRREESTRSFGEVRDEIEKALRKQQLDALAAGWMKRLRNKYTVIYHIPTPPFTL